MRLTCFVVAVLFGLLGSRALAADRFFAFNETTSTVFKGVYLAPAGTTNWGPNEALNDKDKIWDAGERLKINNASRGLFDLKLVDRAGRTCIKHGIDLRKDLTFDIRDQDLAACKP
jgi:hypothetical protein